MPFEPAERPSRLDDPAVSKAAKKAFFRIVDLWQVDNEGARILLGSPGRSTFFAWKKGEGGLLPHDSLERVSYLLGIYKGLQLLFPDAAQADAWVRKPNAAFGGRSALARMLAGHVVDLHFVRSYIDYVRGGV
jgi:hypothetical protein